MPAVLLVAFAAVVIWGGSPVAAKLAVADIRPLDVALLRTVIGGLVALPLILLWRIKLPAGRSDRHLLLLSAFCGFIGFPFLFTIGIDLTSANHASMILACLPIFTGAIAMAWDRRRPKAVWWCGCGIALLGELMLISYHSGEESGATFLGDAIVLASNLFASLGYVAGARLQQAGYPAVATTFWGVVIGALALLPAAPVLLMHFDVTSVSFPAWLSLAYLAVGVTIIGYVAWYWALGQGGIARVGLMQFLQPISGVILAGLLLGETPGALFLMASLIILLGIWLAVRAK